MINNESNIHDDELNDLKSLWQNQTDEKSYDKNQIFKMIHRKSKNSVQWLFYITLAELALAIVFSIWAIVSGTNMISEHLKEVMNEETLKSYDYISHISLVGSCIFVAITFIYFRKISAQLSVKALIDKIIEFRKVLSWLIILWVVLSLAFIFPMYVEMGQQVFMHDYDKGNMSPQEIEQTAKGVGIGLAAISSFLIILFSVLYYGIIYGIFLRRLGKNLKELKKIEP
ncbi:hypothetical protein [Moheibacter sediminis]|uniref:Uncharacterized protein n=1 Tax=Moheibacter sediminis TaxID=1434700 RepID=A0A1W1Z0E4_9FLAO|nr:hypothetical protein [Moheibacter sediminis]SMC41864.1 hypothetical protein SAMN06296427_10274 [Moheibacter sediminis]